MDQAGPHQLIDAPAETEGVTWSPDGKRLAFLARLNGKHLRIFLARPDGSSPEPITPDDDEQGLPSWSPDSRQLAFGDVPPEFGMATGSEVLHVYDLETRRVTDVPGSRGLWTARWSPDGRYLAALTIDTQMMLMLHDMKTRVWRALPDANHINNPSWSHDSKFIYYDTEGGPRLLRRVRIADGHVEDLMDLVDYLVEVPWSGLAPDDSPLILHDTGSVNMYALTLRRR
jgi:Tol biopolymer transport system component